MRPRFLLPLLLAATVTAPCLLVLPSAHAQMSDAERAAARDLFKQGDELQRAGKYADALDKFQRAQQVFQAPTNVLRIAECQTQLGKLVEATEAYRSVIRWPLAPGAPPAFQSAIDQAKVESACRSCKRWARRRGEGCGVISAVWRSSSSSAVV